MHMTLRVALTLTVALLGGSAQAAGMMSYGMATADAELVYEGRAFSIYVHPKQDLLMLQPKLSETFKPPIPPEWPIGFWRGAAEQFVKPAGCGIPEVHVLSKNGATWEASYLCPAGLDLRALILAQRSALKRGSELKAPPP